MFPVLHYIKGIIKNLLNPRVSIFAIISDSVKIDKTTCLYRGVKAKKASIGAYTYVAANTEIENAIIGKFCSIADHCRIGMGAHTLNCLSTSPLFTQKRNGCQTVWTQRNIGDKPLVENTVHIGNDVWIGSHVLINGGVKIGNGVVIGAGAVVVKDVPPYAVIGGVPAKVIRYRFSDNVISRLEELQWWNLSDETLKQNIDLFQKEFIKDDSVNELIFSDLMGGGVNKRFYSYNILDFSNLSFSEGRLAA